jgi:carbon-monoxide dehydrogenase medium subunit
VKAPAFRYIRPATLAEALAALDAEGPEAQVLAGGQSLMPALNLRLSRPSVLVDINRIAPLNGIDLQGETVRIGALARHAAVMQSAIVQQHLPLIAAAMPHLAHPAIRNRGTFGGSVALADPAAELPACCVALGAEIVLHSSSGQRSVRADRFFRGLYETDRQPGEIVTEVMIPAARDGMVFAFDEMARRRGDFAVLGIALQASARSTAIDDLRMVAFGSEAHPRVSTGAATAAAALDGEGIARIATAFAAGLEPIESLHGSAAYKRHLARVLAQRMLQRIAGSRR